MMRAPLIPGTRPVGAAQLAVEHTSTNGLNSPPPGGDGPRPQDRRGGVRTRGEPFTSAQRSRILVQVVAHRKVQSAGHREVGLTRARHGAPAPGCLDAPLHGSSAAPAMEARPCCASNPQRGSIEPAPSPALPPAPPSSSRAAPPTPRPAPRTAIVATVCPASPRPRRGPRRGKKLPDRYKISRKAKIGL